MTTATTIAADIEQKRRKANALINSIAVSFGAEPRPLPRRISRRVPSIRFEPRGDGHDRSRELRTFDQAKAELREIGVEFESDHDLSDALLDRAGIRTAVGVFTAVAAGRRDHAYNV